MNSLPFKFWLAINSGWIRELHLLFLKTGEDLSFDNFAREIFADLGGK